VVAVVLGVACAAPPASNVPAATSAASPNAVLGRRRVAALTLGPRNNIPWDVMLLTHFWTKPIFVQKVIKPHRSMPSKRLHDYRLYTLLSDSLITTPHSDSG
jgi:hypothetical protein